MIREILSKDWSEFYWNELFDSNRNKTKNYYQCFESKPNEYDNPLKYFCEPTWNSDRIYFFITLMT